MSMPATPSSELSLSDKQEVHELSVRFEAELRSAQARLRRVEPGESLVEVLRDLDSKVLLASLLTSQNALPGRLIDLVPVESFWGVTSWLRDAGYRARLSKSHVEDLEAAARFMGNAAQIAAGLAGIANPFAEAVRRMSLQGTIMEMETRAVQTPPPTSPQSDPGMLPKLFSPRAARVELLILAALVFTLARTPTPIGEFLREFSYWLLG